MSAINMQLVVMFIKHCVAKWSGHLLLVYLLPILVTRHFPSQVLGE